MHRRNIPNVTFSNLTQKGEAFKRPGPTNRIRRNKENTWVPQAQSHICCWPLKTAGGIGKKKNSLYLWKYVTESNRNKNPREAKLFVTKLSVYSTIANVVTFCTVVMKAISEE